MRVSGLLLLVFLVLLLLTPPAFADLIAGPMIGHVTDTDARIWLQLDTVDSVRVKAYDADTNQEVSNISLDVEGPSPFVVDAPVNGLSPDRNYRVELFVGDRPVPLVPPPIIRTAPPAGQIEDLTIALGSNLPYSDLRLPIFKTITALQPRACLFLGNVGSFPPDLKDWPEKRKAAFRMMCDQRKKIRLMPALLELFRSTPTYCVWDDADFGTTNADSSFVFSKESLASFQRYWPNPSYGTADTPGCYFTFTLGDADFFVLDDRTYRTATAMLGDAQLAWLKKSLAASRANVKIIAAGTQLLASYRSDSWSNFPAERNNFFSFLASAPVNGVAFITGGKGPGEITLIRRTAYPLVELTSSALLQTNAATTPNPNRAGDPVTTDNFGTLDLTGPRTHRTLTLRLRDPKGRTLLEQVVAVAELHAK